MLVELDEVRTVSEIKGTFHDNEIDRRPSSERSKQRVQVQHASLRLIDALAVGLESKLMSAVGALIRVLR